MTNRGYLWRVGFVLLSFPLLLAGLGVKLVFLHLGPNESLRAKVAQLRHYEEHPVVPRGRILDRHGNILAMDLAMKNIWVNPREILARGHARFIGLQLARVLQMDPAMVFSRINRPTRGYEYIKKLVPADTAEQIKAMQMKGVNFDDVSARHYPQGVLACHVIGFANLEGQGGAGIELKWDRYLRGQPGLRVGERDGKRKEIFDRRVLDIPPEPGANVVLTLDQNLQYLVEQALAKAVERYHAKGAWAIVQRVRTGEILAMASRPGYDLNEYGTTSSNLMMNRAIGYTFEPGSTFKVGVIAAALNEGTVQPEDVFDCENGHWLYQGKILHDYHPYGRLSVADILKKSSNIGAAKVALTLGDRRLESYLREFGFGRPTGIELPGEEGGILNPRPRWTSISISRIPMGHEVGVTALQMLNMLCAVANDGFLMKPTIIKRLEDPQGRVIMESSPVVLGRPIREDTARLMRRLLARVTEEGGTGTRARVPGYTVAGKTGTAQKAIPGGYSDRDNIASFMGFLPVEQPELAIMVVVDEPQPERTGGVVSAPVFQEIAAQAVRYLDVPPVVTAQAAPPEERGFDLIGD